MAPGAGCERPLDRPGILRCDSRLHDQPPPSADAEAGDLLAERPEALCLRRVLRPRPDAVQRLRVGRHGLGDVAVLAVDATEGVELAADRAPDRRRCAL